MGPIPCLCFKYNAMLFYFCIINLALLISTMDRKKDGKLTTGKETGINEQLPKDGFQCKMTHRNLGHIN